MRKGKLITIISVLLTVLMAATLTGCQKSKQEAPTNKQTEKSNTVAPASSSSPSSSSSSSSSSNSGSSSSASSAIPQNGLVLYYNFDETSGTTAKDSSPSGKNATVNGAAWGPGKNSNAIILDGVDDFVQVPEGAVSGLKKFTFSVWVNLNSLSSTQKIFDFSSGSTTENFMKMALNSTTGRIRFGTKTDSKSKEKVALTPDATVTTNKWTHLCLTNDGNTGTLYIDGVKQAEIPDIGITPADLGITTTNYIGKSAAPNDLYLGGKMDDFCFFNRVLSNDEITKIASGK